MKLVISIVVVTNKYSKCVNEKTDFDFRCWIHSKNNDKVIGQEVPRINLRYSQDIFSRDLTTEIIQRTLLDFQVLVTHKSRKFNFKQSIRKSKRKLKNFFQQSLEIFYL